MLNYGYLLSAIGKTMKLIQLPKQFSASLLTGAIALNFVSLPAHAIEGVIEKVAPRSNVEVAIVPLAGAENINGIITNDLTLAGHNVTDKNLPQTPHTTSEVKYEAWQQIGVPYVVVGRSQTDRGNVTLNFEVLDVSAGTVKGTGSVTTKANASALRMAGHKVADRINEILTGVAGDFSGKIVFAVESGSPKNRTSSLVVSDVDGFNPKVIQQVNGTIKALTPSANGRTFTYMVQQQGYPVVYSADVVGGSPTLLTPFKANNLGGAISPDGGSVVFSSDFETGKNQIYLSRGNGKPQRLTNDPIGAIFPSWSPDGNSVVFTSNRAGNNRGQIYRYDLRSGSTQALTGGGLNSMGRISNDGKKMSLLSGTSQGAIMDLGSRSVTGLNNAGMSEAPSISPNGQHYIYSSRNVITIVSNGKTVSISPSQNGAPSGTIYGPIWLNPDANNSTVR